MQRFPTPTHIAKFLCLLLLSSFLFLWGDAAYAQSSYVPPSQYESCSGGIPSEYVVTRVVYCIEGSIRIAMLNFLNQFSIYISPTIMVLFAFSMILLGIRISAGVEDLSREVVGYIIRFAFVVWFCTNLGGLQNVPFDIVHYASALVTGGYSPWVQMDQYMGTFFGYGNGRDLYNGIMGLVVAAMFSSLSGVLVFIMSMLAMLTTVYFGFRAVYSYLAAILLIAFTILISPMVIPLAIFEHTNQRYVKKWIDYLIGAMLHPVLLFAFLYMFLGTINYMINWFIFGIFNGNTDFSPYWRSDQSLFSWLMTSDPSTMQVLGNTIGEQNTRQAVQSFVSPTLSTSVDINPLNTFSLDFGPQQVWALQLMVFGFLGIFIVSYLMLSMVNRLPQVADSIVGVVTGLTLEGIPFVNEMRQTLMRMKGAYGK